MCPKFIPTMLSPISIANVTIMTIYIMRDTTKSDGRTIGIGSFDCSTTRIHNAGKLLSSTTVSFIAL